MVVACSSYAELLQLLFVIYLFVGYVLDKLPQAQKLQISNMEALPGKFCIMFAVLEIS